MALIFLEAVLAIEINQSNLEKKANHSILKNYFSSRKDPWTYQVLQLEYQNC